MVASKFRPKLICVPQYVSSFCRYLMTLKIWWDIFHQPRTQGLISAPRHTIVLALFKIIGYRILNYFLRLLIASKRRGNLESEARRLNLWTRSRMHLKNKRKLRKISVTSNNNSNEGGKSGLGSSKPPAEKVRCLFPADLRWSL